MSDFQNLPPQMQTALQIKLDGFIEACVQASRALNIGLTEAIDLTIRALMREIAAHKLDPDKVDAMWESALGTMVQASAPSTAQTIN